MEKNSTDAIDLIFYDLGGTIQSSNYCDKISISINRPKLDACTISLADRNNNQRITAPVWTERVKHATSYPPRSRRCSNGKKSVHYFLKSNIYAKIRTWKSGFQGRKWLLLRKCKFFSHRSKSQKVPFLAKENASYIYFTGSFWTRFG